MNSCPAIDIDADTKFKTTYKSIREHLLPNDISKELVEVYVWLQKVFDYNVPHGKHIRGQAVVSTFRLMAKHYKRIATEEELELSRVLGWVIEIQQACCLIIDDFMDQSITRRGQPCWYRLPEVGLKALNDVILIEQTTYYILRQHFSDKKYYQKLVDLMHEITRHTSMGQYMDSASNRSNSGPKFQLFTQSRYQTICCYKSSFYTTVLPVRYALYMSDIDSDIEHKNAEEVLLKIGLLFQINDDFMDCFGDPVITGKVGTDIEKGKCCWPIVSALNRCDERQRLILESNYGNKCPESVLKVKAIYNELKLKQVFNSEVEVLLKDISRTIDDLKTKSDLNPKIFTKILSYILKTKLMTNLTKNVSK